MFTMKLFVSLICILWMTFGTSATITCSTGVTPSNTGYSTVEITFSNGFSYTLPTGYYLDHSIRYLFRYSFTPDFRNVTSNIYYGSEIYTAGPVEQALVAYATSTKLVLPIAIWPYNSTLYIQYNPIPFSGFQLQDGGVNVTSFNCSAVNTNFFIRYLSVDNSHNPIRAAYLFFSTDVQNCNGSKVFANDAVKVNDVVLQCTLQWFPVNPLLNSKEWYCIRSGTAFGASNGYPSSVTYANITIQNVCDLNNRSMSSNSLYGQVIQQGFSAQSTFHQSTPSGVFDIYMRNIQQIVFDTSTRSISSMLLDLSLPCLSGGYGFSLFNGDIYTLQYPFDVNDPYALYKLVLNMTYATATSPIKYTYTNAATSTSLSLTNINSGNILSGDGAFTTYTLVLIKNARLTVIDSNYAVITLNDTGFVSPLYDVELNPAQPSLRHVFDSVEIKDSLYCHDNVNYIPFVAYGNNSVRISLSRFTAPVPYIKCYAIPTENLATYVTASSDKKYLIYNDPVTVSLQSARLDAVSSYLSDNSTVVLNFDVNVYTLNISALILMCGSVNGTATSYINGSTTGQVIVYFSGCNSTAYTNPILFVDITNLAILYTMSSPGSFGLTDKRFYGSIPKCEIPTVDGTGSWAITNFTSSGIIITCGGQVFSQTLAADYTLTLARTDCHIFGANGMYFYFNTTSCFTVPYYINTTTNITTIVTIAGSSSWPSESYYAIGALGGVCAILTGILIYMCLKNKPTDNSAIGLPGYTTKNVPSSSSILTKKLNGYKPSSRPVSNSEMQALVRNNGLQNQKILTRQFNVPDAE